MKKTVPFLALTFTAAVLASAAWAQETQNQPPAQNQAGQAQAGERRGYGRMTPEQQAKDLKDKLGLSDEQTTKVEAILKDQQKANADAREKAAGDREAMMTAMRDNTKKFDAKIDEVLNADQKTKIAAIRAERDQRMQQRRPPSNPQ